METESAPSGGAAAPAAVPPTATSGTPASSSAVAAQASSASAEAGPSRTVQVYKPPSPSVALPYPSPPAPSDDPKPTPAELKAAFADHIQQRHGPDAPLMTKAMREKHEARYGKPKKVWENVKIRVRFSDRTQIESVFPSHAPIDDVYAFVTGSLRPEVLEPPPQPKRRFTLYTAPPKKDYLQTDPKIKGKGLAELGLAPAAMLNVRWENEPAMNSNSYPAPLRPELLNAAQDLPPPKPFDQAAPQSQAPAAGAGKTLGGSGSGQRDPKAMPKWLKGLSKK